MASLKILKSIAHNLAHHFSSTLSMWKTDYTINHLGKASKEFNIDIITIDVLNNTISPIIINQNMIQEFVPHYQIFLNELLAKHSFSTIELESVIIQYDFSTTRESLYDLPTYNTTVTIKTKTGKKFQSFLTEKS